MTSSIDEPKRRRWPWIVLLIAVGGIAGGLWLRSTALADRERLRVWKTEAEGLGLQGLPVVIGGIPFVGRLAPLDWLMRDKIAYSLPNDAVAIRLISVRAPFPAGLVLIDEGLSSEVARQLGERFPGVGIHKWTPPPVVAAPAAAGNSSP